MTSKRQKLKKKTNTSMNLSSRLFLLFFVLVAHANLVSAQQESVTGRVIDKETRTAMGRTTLQLYRLGTARNGKKDTTFVKGVYSDADGRFNISQVRAGQYFLKITFLGYKEQRRNLTKADGRQLALGDIYMEPDAVQLKDVKE